MLDLTVNALWRTRHDEMHEAAERATHAARRLGDARLIAPALAELALAGSMMRAAERAEANRAEAAALVDSLSDDELAGHLEAATWLAGVELYLDRYAEGEAHAERALTIARATGQGELSSSWRQRSAGSAASGENWSSRPSCSTTASRRPACSGTRTRSSGRSSVARRARCEAGTSSSLLPPRRRASI